MLTFEEETHTYRLDGVIIPHVTAILEEMGLVDTQWFNEKTSALGRAVHKACHFYNEGDLDWSSLDSEVGGYVGGWVKFVKDNKYRVLKSEDRVYDPIYRYAGTLDNYGIYKGEIVLIDIITGPSTRPKQLQTAAYARCINFREYRKLRSCIQLTPDGNYIPHPYKSPQDEPVFLSALAVYQWKRANK